ncbi:phytoene desaturase family protein [Serpentinicella sp. ANB-PHB4]|uniref:phytoene desaturase family protein n=1 Tax=Serpentinicella sp. ANB-PHB4 TaxID=3074076 RepID=UPI0028625D14|nr:phytoene desaturase family protein [Serpentinicella sp. ANB-PHB4]MDR5659069.1 phytoene desaturase family protein [Serpentinicella sp. ANB-PHB4]
MDKKVIIVGAGPGGLTAGMLLASQGYDVEIFEKQSYIGGRTSMFEMNGYKFDLGPTFLMMNHVLEDVFKKTGRDIEDYLDIKKLDPMYRIVYGDSGRDFYPSSKHEKMESEIERLFPGNIPGYRRYLQKEKNKYNILFECLKETYLKPGDFLKKELIKSIPYLGVRKSLFDVLGSYFKEDDLKMAFTFQAKYLGMSPWECPGAYSIISYVEHDGGVHHVMGGLGEITNVMAKVIEEEGGKIHLNTPIKELLIQNGKVIGVELENGEKEHAEYTIVNADFGHAMTNLVGEQHRKKYTKKKIEKSKYSCSTFMLYLGVDKIYDIPHHNILFSNDYKNNVNEISKKKILSEDPSVYIQNAVVTDGSLAPEGKSTIYVLVPVPNNTSEIDWEKEKASFREKILNILEERGGLSDIKDHIEVERMVTPLDWEEKMDVYKGAVFNLGHNISQMLYFRPHNQFEEFENCYLVGGGTHPGSGLPTIFQSGIISTDLIVKRDAKDNKQPKKYTAS